MTLCAHEKEHEALLGKLDPAYARPVQARHSLGQACTKGLELGFTCKSSHAYPSVHTK